MTQSEIKKLLNQTIKLTILHDRFKARTALYYLKYTLSAEIEYLKNQKLSNKEKSKLLLIKFKDIVADTLAREKDPEKLAIIQFIYSMIKKFNKN